MATLSHPSLPALRRPPSVHADAWVLLALALGSAAIGYFAFRGQRIDATPTARLGFAAPGMEPEPPVVAPAAAPASSDDRGACPAEMVLVEGDACSEVRETCTKWMEDPDATPYARCETFAPSSCAGATTHARFCIDREEHTARGETKPTSDVSYTDAERACRAEGKRLCGEDEWTFACEGEAMLPYPYGLERNAAVCNFDVTDLVDGHGEMRDRRAAVTEYPQCLSPFGVHDMVGNVDEWVKLSKVHYGKNGKPMWSGLKGGWWGPYRNRCRPVTVDHDERFHELQTGFRCCADAG